MKVSWVLEVLSWRKICVQCLSAKAAMDDAP